jgi:hypothetical protein
VTATVGQLRDAIRDAVERNIPGLSAFDTWPGQINPPAALVRPVGIVYSQAFDSLSILNFEVVLVVRQANLRASQDALDLYISPAGPQSIQAAIESDQTLGGLSEIVNVLRMHSYGDLAIANAIYLGAIFDLEVHAS